MIRILHLTDFHLDNRTLRDWKDFYKDAFFKKLDELQNDNKIDIILFTGDLVDKSGKDFGGGIPAFNKFKDEIIYPILNKLNLDISRFIICPGNHDVNRSADDEIDEIGMKGYLTNTDKVIEFINSAEKESNYTKIKRIEDYKKFEFELYNDSKEEKIHDIFALSLRFRIDDKLIGISSLNSSWRCYGDDDFQNLLIGENQLNKNFQFIKDCDIKIAIVHHQLSWLSEVESRTIKSHINRDFDIVFSGHVHENQSEMTTGFTGSCLYIVSPSGLNQIRTDNKTFQNGFTVVDYNKNILCKYFKYEHEKKEFEKNNDVCKNGEISFIKPPEEPEDVLRIIRKATSNIKEVHFEEMDDHFIKGKFDSKVLTVKEAFVFPPIDMGDVVESGEKEIINLEHLVRSPNSVLFLGSQESGKKSLLYRIIVEYVDEVEIYNKVPVFIDFKNIKNKEITQLIKEYCQISYVEVENLLKGNNLVLVIDNLDYNETSNVTHVINKLQNFHKTNPHIKIISTYDSDFLSNFPPEIIQFCKIPFNYYFIRSLRTNEIKQIMKRWVPEAEGVHKYDNLEKLVNTFISYNLPNNALSVHLYLWSLENSERKPINQAVLMEIYIELILEKLKEENVYRESFDFTNKLQLISKIAEKMVKKADGIMSLTYSDFVKEVESYIKEEVGFTFDTDIICKYLLERKIFIKTKDKEIQFAHLCFTHFFIAKRMQFNHEFKAYVLDETRYFNFVKEIDYYTGLVRSDLETFNLIFDRFKSLFEPMSFILGDINPDEYFNISIKANKDKEKVNNAEEIPLARNIELARVKDSRPTSIEIEKKFDEQLKRISPAKNESKNRDNINFDRMLLLMCYTLRNSEGIEDLNLKKEAYSTIIKHNLTYSILYNQLLIQYIIEHKKLPPAIPQNISLELLLKNIPYNIQQSLNIHLNTKKLEAVILHKINRDSLGESHTKSEIEKFLSIALYADIYGKNFEKILRKFIKSVSTVPTQNYLLFKLTHYLHKRSNPDSDNEKMYLDMIFELKIRTQKLPRRLKESIIKEIKESRDRFNKFIGLN